MASRTMKKSSGHLKRGKGNMYNAVGAPEEGEAMDTEPGFKKGGRAHHKKKHHLKHGGHAEGHEPKHRADKKSRGGHAHMKHGGHHHRAAGGRTPYSSGSKVAMGENGGKTETGHEGQRPG